MPIAVVDFPESPSSAAVSARIAETADTRISAAPAATQSFDLLNIPIGMVPPVVFSSSTRRAGNSFEMIFSARRAGLVLAARPGARFPQKREDFGGKSAAALLVLLLQVSDERLRRLVVRVGRVRRIFLAGHVVVMVELR